MHFKSLLKEQVIDLNAYKKHTKRIFIYMYVHFKLSHSYLKKGALY